MPRVSVIIPAYNAEWHLQAAVESVLVQTFSDFEIIIVNDGSQDATQAIAERLRERDPRVRVVQTENRGVEVTRNAGVDRADAEWVAFLDADDRWTSVKLARQLSLLNTRPELAATSSYGFYVGPKDRTLGLLEIGPTSIEDLRRRRDLQKPVWLLTSSVVCRREVLISHGGFDPSFGGAAEDLDLWTRIGERHDIVTIPEYLVAFRISAVSASMVKHLQVQQNTVRVRLNIRRRALGLPVADAHEFRTWLAAHDAEVIESWTRAWRSAYYYRQAGHHFLHREYVNGFVDLARSSLASPRHVARKLRRQVVPFILRGIGTGGCK